MSMKIRIPEHIMEAVRESAKIFYEKAIVSEGWIKWTVEDAKSHFNHWLHPRLWKQFVHACYELNDEPFAKSEDPYWSRK